MIQRVARILTVAVVSAASAALPPTVDGQIADRPVHVLDVPYLPQNEALCGGAAAAMVLRYWGVKGVYPESFAGLVDPQTDGIKSDELIRVLQTRGWQAMAFRGDPGIVESHLAKRRPIVALIQDRPERFHYVVVVGWSDTQVIVHDPARAPFRVLKRDAFIRVWRQTGFWTMLVLPGDNDMRLQPAPPVEDSATRISSTTITSETCPAMVDEGVRLAGLGHLDDAERLFVVAAISCPHDAAPWRERAGVHAVRSEWKDAEAHARAALARNPGDAHAARILATSLFLEDRPDEALDAWNQLDEPIIDVVNVRGLERIQERFVERTMRLDKQTLLTADRLRAARKRLSELPAVAGSRVAFTPDPTGLANVEVAVIERSVLPTGVVPLTVTGLRVLTDREVAVAVASPTGGGELLSASWRWWERRPRVAVAVSTPSAVRHLGSLWTVEAFVERQTYETSADAVVEERRGGSVRIADWLSGRFRWEAGGGVDRWAERGITVSLVGALEHRALGDRIRLEADVSGWLGHLSAATTRLRTEWRSSIRNEETVWLAGIGLNIVSRSAPLALWPGAGTGQGRDGLLRAHPLLHDGRVRGMFGRRLVSGSGEWRRWSQPGRWPVRVGMAFFADTAFAAQGLRHSDRSVQADIGTGVRFAVPGTGTLRVDVARGLRDGSTALSVGWLRNWR